MFQVIITNADITLSLLIALLSLIIATITLRTKQGVKLTHAYIPPKLPLFLHSTTLRIPITNHKDKSVRINDLFIKISNIHIKIPTSSFTIPPYATEVVELKLSSIYGLEPNIELSYTTDHFSVCPPIIPVIGDALDKQYDASGEIADLITKITQGKFDLKANTELKRIKIKYKALKKNKEQILSIVTLDEAKRLYIDITGVDSYIEGIDIHDINLEQVISCLSHNSYHLTKNNEIYSIKKTTYK